ncbi:BTB/POZ domain-containing protein 2 [Stylophora pistillata]|uniref:BTB/POZ domain-containing protein 2 n=1 Tax=Stylophora pistillata TaxID=50429 RepID=A0A2B4R7Q4_STYPI|nr:BTB/POZ domain-containing protein 2 [Stylophora pistillata]
MSLVAVSQDYWSEMERFTIRERCKFMFNNELLSKVKFVVQDVEAGGKIMKTIPAHKFVLAIGSPVFYAMFYEAQKYEEKDLVDICMEVFDEHADEAVKSDAFVTIEKSLLEELMERDSLNVTEVELFKAVDCWARHEYEKKNLAPEESMKIRILGETVVGNIRFPVMKQKKFVGVILDCEILTPDEAHNMMNYFNGMLPKPVEFGERKRGGSQWISRFSALGEGWKYGRRFDITPDAITFSVNKTIELYAVRLFGSENNEYNVILTVYDDFINPDGSMRRLRPNAVPSIFVWTKDIPLEDSEQEKIRPAVRKLEAIRMEQDEATDTASEGEGDLITVDDKICVSRKTQTIDDDLCSEKQDCREERMPCSHRFSVSHLLSTCTTVKKETKLFTDFTGFNSYEEFRSILHFILPGLDRKQLIYWDSEAVLQKKLHVGEVKKGDAVMADKGFDIATELQKVGIGSTYLPFLKINLGSMKMMSSKLKP